MSSSDSENWSTISPNAVVNMVDLHSAPTLAAEDGAFDLLGEDPLEWLIETDTQQYLPESSLPLFPFLDDDKVVYAGEEEEEEPQELARKEPESDMVEDAILNNMVDPNVTMQSLFLPSVDIMQQ
jgi:hypothetical protein